MSLSQSCVAKLYASVIDDVIGCVREIFNDEGVDEQVLMELKQSWETRLKTTKAVELNKPEPEPQPPMIKNHKPGAGSGMMPVDFNSNPVSVHVTLPPSGHSSEPRILTVQVPGDSLHGQQLQSLITGPVVQATLALPDDTAAQMLQQHIINSLQGQTASLISAAGLHNGSSAASASSASGFSSQANPSNSGVPQVDGVRDSSDEDDDAIDENDDDNDDDDDEKEDEEEVDVDNAGVEEEPLNSSDDVSDDDPTEMFETDNVVVCQYDKITRSRNKWKFYLKDGIMNLGGKDFVFQKSNGDAEW